MDRTILEQQIDRFVQNEMTPDEREQFVLSMRNDKELKEQVAIRYLLLEGTLINNEEKARMALINIVHTNNRKRIRWIAAACIILLLGMGGWFGNQPMHSPQELYLIYHSIPAIERARGGNELTEKNAVTNVQLTEWYEQGKYKDIADWYNRNRQENTIDALPDYTSLFIAVALLEQENAGDATTILLQIKSTDYREETEWLLLCCYLKTNQREEAEELANKIQTEKGIFANAAGRIKTDLKKKRWF
ncbi:hypothetical protein [Bacteroides faecium]|uniref:Tetratricopeptide repeat protein n=1 Tax=Bacteroides faecium TaxID=2715212 RepID=A0A6H0KR52_9BACE|nr:hypothetical protein [Bacteroides faecium]QIU95934.1 hypothetical protein BacF7301_18045 [Bacteroides faecium]